MKNKQRPAVVRAAPNSRIGKLAMRDVNVIGDADVLQLHPEATIGSATLTRVSHVTRSLGNVRATTCVGAIATLAALAALVPAFHLFGF